MKRKPNESFKDYKIRRKKANEDNKKHLAGDIVWTKGMGIYIKSKHRHIVQKILKKIKTKTGDHAKPTKEKRAAVDSKEANLCKRI